MYKTAMNIRNEYEMNTNMGSLINNMKRIWNEYKYGQPQKWYEMNINMGSLTNQHNNDNTNKHKENITKGKHIDNYTCYIH